MRPVTTYLLADKLLIRYLERIKSTSNSVAYLETPRAQRAEQYHVEYLLIP